MSVEPVVLSDFCSIFPKFHNDQANAIRWLATAHAEAQSRANPEQDATEQDADAKASRIARMTKLITRFGCDPTRVQTRYSALEDFTHEDWQRMRIFRLGESVAGLSARERSLFFEETVNEVFRRFYSETVSPPDRMIHVTCTGYVSPSGAQRLVTEKTWGDRVTVTHAYHMGCYASLPSVRMAQGYLGSDPEISRVDLVHTELCSLHMDPSQDSAEQLVVQSLFSDGFIKYSAQRLAPHGRWPEKKSGFEVISCREELVSETEGAMTWMASDHGMRMTLSRDVPELISKVLQGFLSRLAESADMEMAPLLADAIFAIHPGGPKIIDRISELLSLGPEQNAHSRKVLRERGNMSSATLPHVWKEILDDTRVPDQKTIVSLAFGPGLTVSGAIFKKRARE